MQQHSLLNRAIRWAEGLLSLLVVGLMLAAGVVSGGRLFGHDIAPQADKDGATSTLPTAPTADELAALGFAGQTLVPADSGIWTVRTTSGETLATIVGSAHFAPDVQGFAGPTPVFVAIGADGKVGKIVAQANDETPDFFRKVIEKKLLDSWTGQPLATARETTVDAVSGATFSSKALIVNVQTALNAGATAGTKPLPAPAIGWPRAIAVLLVVALGVVASFRYRGRKKVRLAVLLLNVGVLGFWNGQFISLAMLRGWTANGLDVMAMLPAVVLLVATLLLSFFGKKNHHCTWVCPYGSLQELAYRLPLPKVKLPAKAYALMRRLRFGVLLALLLAAWLGFGIDSLLDYEPFSAFLVTTAAPGVLLLAAAFVVASIFVPNVWCQALCPVGEVLNLAYDQLPPKKKTNASQPSHNEQV